MKPKNGVHSQKVETNIVIQTAFNHTLAQLTARNGLHNHLLVSIPKGRFLGLAGVEKKAEATFGYGR